MTQCCRNDHTCCGTFASAPFLSFCPPSLFSPSFTETRVQYWVTQYYLLPSIADIAEAGTWLSDPGWDIYPTHLPLQKYHPDICSTRFIRVMAELGSEFRVRLWLGLRADAHDSILGRCRGGTVLIFEVSDEDVKISGVIRWCIEPKLIDKENQETVI